MSELRRIGDVAEDFLGVVEERQRRGGVETVGVPTGLHKVDEWTGGFQSNQVWIFGARAGVGKTALALDVSLHVARQNIGTIFYSLEMSAESLVKRLLSRMTNVPGGRIERGKMDTSEVKALRRAADEMADLKLAIHDGTLTSEELVEHALRTADKARGGIGLVVVDYVGLLRDQNKFGETQRIGTISNTIRTLARPDHLNAPVVLLAQLNRMVENREDHTPQLSDLRDSGQLEQDAHVVLLPYRPYMRELMKGAAPQEAETDARIIIAKNRDGIVGSTPAVFYPKQTKWVQQRPEAVEPKSRAA